MNILDSRDLIEERDSLKEDILNDFKDTFEHYADDTNEYEDILFEEEELESWIGTWQIEIDRINSINDLEDEISDREWDYGIIFIPEDDFTDYCEDLVTDIGDLPKELPSYISNNIDWDGVADDLRVDYFEVSFDGISYLYRA